MQMDGWEDRLHTSFLGEHVLFEGLRLTSFSSFFWAVLLTLLLCFAERSLTLALTRHWSPFRSIRRSRLRNALWRTGLYWVVTLLRLLYMLISMTFHVGLILVTVTALSIGQFVIEYLEQPQQTNFRDSYRLHEPLLSPETFDKPRSPPSTRPRSKSKSKPSSIFIHPNNSNIARADAAAVEMGLHGSTENVKASTYPDEASAWEHGKGRDVARELLGGSKVHARSESQHKLFRIADGESDDGESV